MGQCLIPDLLPLDLQVFNGVLTLGDQNMVCAGNSSFKVLQFEA